MKFNSIQEVINLNKSDRGKFFEKDTLKALGSRFSELIQGRYFVSSELFPWSNEKRVRKYTIRFATPKGRILTFGQYGGFSTMREALTAVRKFPEALPEAVDFFYKCYKEEDGLNLTDFYNTCRAEAEKKGNSLKGIYRTFADSCVYCMMNSDFLGLTGITYSRMRYQFFEFLEWIEFEGTKADCEQYLIDTNQRWNLPVIECLAEGFERCYVVSKEAKRKRIK